MCGLNMKLDIDG